MTRAPEERKLALWHGALRELIEEAGGAALPAGAAACPAYRVANDYPPEAPSEFTNVVLPPAVLAATPSEKTHFWLGDASDTGSPELHKGRGSWFAHVIGAGPALNDAVWASDAWRPRAQPQWRLEMDESYNKHGLVHGYVWVELRRVFEHPGQPVAGSSMGLATFAAKLFVDEGKSRLKSVIRQVRSPPPLHHSPRLCTSPRPTSSYPTPPVRPSSPPVGSPPARRSHLCWPSRPRSRRSWRRRPPPRRRDRAAAPCT